MRAMISVTTPASRLSGGQALADHLDRAADRRERILHLVRDDRGHLAEARQRRLLAQPLFHSHARRSGRAGCR